MSDLAARVLAAIADEERFANNARGLLGIENPWWTWQALKARFPDLSRADCVHISRHGARDSLRRCAADRKMVEYVMDWKHEYNGADPYYSCSQAAHPDLPSYTEQERAPGGGCDDPERSGEPCDCGVENRRLFILQRLAEGYGIEVGK